MPNAGTNFGASEAAGSKRSHSSPPRSAEAEEFAPRGGPSRPTDPLLFCGRGGTALEARPSTKAIPTSAVAQGLSFETGEDEEGGGGASAGAPFADGSFRDSG